MKRQNSINNISPEKISFYLENKGWVKRDELRQIGSIWQLKNDETVVLSLPLNEKYSDFKVRLLEIIFILEEVEKRPKSAIFKEISH